MSFTKVKDKKKMHQSEFWIYNQRKEIAGRMKNI